MSDGAIRIDTRLNNDNLPKDLKDLEKMCDKAVEGINRIFTTIDGRRDFDLGKEGIEDFTGYIKFAEEEVKRLRDELQALKGDRSYGASDKKNELREQINEFTDGIAMAKERIGQLKVEISDVGQELNTAISTEIFLDSIRSQEQYNALLAETGSRLRMIEEEAQRIADKNGKTRQEVLATNLEYRKTETRYNKLVQSADRFKDKVEESALSTEKIGAGLDKVVKKIAKMAGAILGVRAAYNLVRKVAGAYLNDNESLTNQIQASWSVLGEMLGPIIERLVNLLSRAIGYINVFYKALTGVDAIASYNAKALDKQSKATAGLAKAQAQLAGFDEQTKLQDTTAGSGGSSSAAVFEEPELNPEIVKQIEWLAENMKTILEIAGAIGIGLLAWKIASKLPANMKTLSGLLKTVAGLAIGVYGYIDAWESEIDWNNLLTMVGGFGIAISGVTQMFGGLGTQAGRTAGSVAGVVAGLAEVVVGTKDWIDNGATAQNLATIETGIATMAISLAGATGGWSLLIGLVAGGAVALVNYSISLDRAAHDVGALTEEQLLQFEENNRLIDSYYDIAKASEVRVGAIDDEIDRIQGLWAELQTLADENGKVSETNKEHAELILTELNDALGTEYTMTGNVIKNYQKMQEEIQGVIAAHEFQILMTALTDEYSAALIAESGAHDNLIARMQALDEQKEYTAAIEKRIAELQEEYANRKIDANDEVLTSEFETYAGEMELLKAALASSKKYQRDHQEAYDEALTSYQDIQTTLARFRKAEESALLGEYNYASDILTRRGTAYEDYADTVEGSIGDAVDAMWAKADDSYYIGVEIVNGVVKGIKAGEGGIAAAAAGAAKGALSAMQTALEIKSPSKATQRFGLFLGAGLEAGLDEGTDGIVDSIDKQVNAMLNAYDDASFSIAPDLQLPQVPKLERGGIVNNPGRSIHSLAGGSWVDSLVQNDNSGLLDALTARTDAGTVVIPVYLDGKVIAKQVIDLNQRRAFALNGGY